MKFLPGHIAEFACDILGKPLYPYQTEIADAILESVLGEHGRLFTVMMARQTGKNQLSAVLEAYLLHHMSQGTIIKAAPTFSPQILNSRLRLLSLLDTLQTRGRLWTSSGYIVGLAPQPDPALLRAQTGPRVMFYSAAPESNVMGATAELLLEIDEAQHVSREKFDRDFRPMASANNATTILYGTALSDTTLLAQQRAVNLALEQRTARRNHFEYDWHALAAIKPSYRSLGEQEIARLGEEDATIQTQYLLRPVSGADLFFGPLQLALLQGRHAWEDAPADEECYIAGMDIGGEERPSQGSAARAGHRKRDSTVITIGRLHYNELNLPCIEVVHHHWWTGMPFLEQYAAALALVEQWNLRSLVVDATGLGSTLASLLEDRLGHQRVNAFTFTRPSKSHLTYQLLTFLNSNLLKLYASHQAPRAIYDECWQQMRQARCRRLASEVLDMYVDPADGHDDFLISLALLTEGLDTLIIPPASAMIRPRPLFEGEGRY